MGFINHFITRGHHLVILKLMIRWLQAFSAATAANKESIRIGCAWPKKTTETDSGWMGYFRIWKGYLSHMLHGSGILIYTLVMFIDFLGKYGQMLVSIPYMEYRYLVISKNTKMIKWTCFVFWLVDDLFSVSTTYLFSWGLSWSMSWRYQWTNHLQIPGAVLGQC